MKKLGLILGLILPVVALGALSEQDRAFIAPRNILVNPGFEYGKPNWTASGGTYTITTTAANVGTGTSAASWDSNAAGQTFTSSAVTIPAGMYGTNAVARCRIQTPSGQATHKLMAFDGTTEINATTIGSSTSYQATTVNFIMPSSGTIALRLKSVAANEPNINIDDCYVGPADNVGTVAQAQFVGSAYIADTTSCVWTSTSSTLAAFSTVAACPGPVVVSNPGPGTIQTTDTDLPQFTVNSLPPGVYEVKITLASNVSSSSGRGTFAINDGTNTSGYVDFYGENGFFAQKVLIGYFTYTTAGNRTFSVYGSVNTGNITIQNDSAGAWKAPGPLNFSITRLPSTPELAYKPDQTPASWSGYSNGFTGSNTVCSTSSTSFADVSACTSIALNELYNRNFGTVTTAAGSLPGITFIPPRTGRYQVCAAARVNGSNGIHAFRMTDGSGNVINAGSLSSVTAAVLSEATVCGILNVSSVSSTTVKLQAAAATGTIYFYIPTTPSGVPGITWSIFQLDAPMAAPYLTGSVTSNTSGAERVERVQFGTTAAKTVCSASPCSYLNQTGSWVSSVTRNSTGNYTVNIATGIFSATPTCTCKPYASGNNMICQGTSTSDTSTAITVSTVTLSGPANADAYVDLICMGPR